jgi:hypothetical protein
MPRAELATVENISAEALRNIRLVVIRLAFSALKQMAPSQADAPGRCAGHQS